ncbi:MAG TPA: hypothetical protein VI413_01965 [Paludibacter sp.]
MKHIILGFFISIFFISEAQTKSAEKPVLNTLEDFFRFENVEQLTSYFGTKNVFSETVYFSDPSNGGKPYLVSEVNFGTAQSILVTWNSKGTEIFQVQVSSYFQDRETGKMRMISNNWKTKQGLYAGMKLSQITRINWFPFSFNTQLNKGVENKGEILLHFGWIKKDIKVPFSSQKLVYSYTLDLKRISDYFPQLSALTLKSNNKLVRKWNPTLELITIYREGLNPQNVSK